jgi:type II pantothenate kinase
LFFLIQVDSDEHFSRIGGTATGGGTFWGLGKLLTSAKVGDSLKFKGTVLRDGFGF